MRSHPTGVPLRLHGRQGVILSANDQDIHRTEQPQASPPLMHVTNLVRTRGDTTAEQEEGTVRGREAIHELPRDDTDDIFLGTARFTKLAALAARQLLENTPTNVDTIETHQSNPSKSPSPRSADASWIDHCRLRMSGSPRASDTCKVANTVGHTIPIG